MVQYLQFRTLEFPLKQDLMRSTMGYKNRQMALRQLSDVLEVITIWMGLFLCTHPFSAQSLRFSIAEWNGQQKNTIEVCGIEKVAKPQNHKLLAISSQNRVM